MLQSIEYYVTKDKRAGARVGAIEGGPEREPVVAVSVDALSPAGQQE